MHKVDDTIPVNNPHSISVNLPTWQSVIDFVHDEEDITTHTEHKFKHGYPRVKLHPLVNKLCNVIREKYAKDNESCLCFPSYNVAKRCREYIRFKSQSNVKVRILQLATSKPINSQESKWKKECKIAVVFVKDDYYAILREYWQLSGEIISSRIAEYVLHELFILSSNNSNTINNKNTELSKDQDDFNFTFTDRAKKLIKKRITNNFVDLNAENEDSNYHFNDNNNDTDSNVNSATYLDSETSNSNNNNNNASNNHLSDWDLNFENGEDFQEIDEGVTTQNNVTTGLNSMIPPEPIFADTEPDSNILTNLHVRTESMTAIDAEETRESLVDPKKDVFLFPSGMASLFTTLRLLLQFDLRRVNRTRSNASTSSSTTNFNENDTNTSTNDLSSLRSNSGTDLLNDSNGKPINVYKKTVMFGLPYSDTLKMLKTFNNTYFLPNGENESMIQLKKILHSGEQILAVFIESPSNPLLKMGNIIELKELSEMFGFYIILDESIGSFVNIDGLQYADIVCSSLSKIFSSETSTMAGTLILNPKSKIYSFAQEFLNELGEYEDNLWCKDILYLEKDSRDYVARTMKTNLTCEYLLDNLLIPEQGKIFKEIYYPKVTSSITKTNYDTIKCNKDSGYGNIFSVTFYSLEKAKLFYDSLDLYKGPSLGSNVTMAIPYTILQYGKNEKDLQEAIDKFGLDETLIRISIGCESRKTLMTIFQDAINKIK